MWSSDLDPLSLCFLQDEKDKQLQEKEIELRRMQEIVAAMQEQIKQQSVSSLQSLVSNQQ